MSDLLPLALFILFPIIFILWWMFVISIIAHLSGWKRLAATYAAVESFEGIKYSGQSGRFGLANYNGCLTIWVSESGLFLDQMFLFRFGHKPLLIPWAVIEPETKKAFFRKVTQLTFSTHPEMKLEISAKTFEKMMGAL